jgi:hypothetical protein
MKLVTKRNMKPMIQFHKILFEILFRLTLALSHMLQAGGKTINKMDVI